MFYKRGLLKNVTKFTAKHFNKVRALRPAAFLKKKPQPNCFFCGFCKIFKNTHLVQRLRKTDVSRITAQSEA